MKKFSKHWTASKKPKKQRKYRYNAPLHLRQKLVSSNLSKELRKRYKVRSISVRKGDSVKVMRGGFKGKTAKVASVDLRKLKVSLEGIQRTKKDGTKVTVNFDPSNLQIHEVVEDSRRFKFQKLKNK
ncbi:MAG: 50S ribosomal protein L24 [Nanoarchaeota archaeon]